MNTKPILLVEDDANDQMLILRSLKKHNILNDVLLANDGAEALEMLYGTGPHENDGPLDPSVVLLDVNMPKVGGLDVLKRIRSEPSTKHLPVVILTSSDEMQDKFLSYDLGANSYVRKPVDFNEFADAVGNLGLYWAVVNEAPPKE